MKFLGSFIIIEHPNVDMVLWKELKKVKNSNYLFKTFTNLGDEEK